VRRLAVVAFYAVASTALLGQQEGGGVEAGHVITGRVADPLGLRPEGAILMLGHQEGLSSFSSTPVAIAADGTFITPRLRPDTYVLEMVRTPHSSTNPATVVGWKLVSVGGSDVAGITVDVRRDVAIIGRFRMESDNPKAEWPSHMHVIAFLALDGVPFGSGASAEGRPAGEFLLQNIYGPRVLRCGYALGPGSAPWYFSKVLLDGKDITNVQTDFSEHPEARLEVVFTQHPARIVGTVVDSNGQPANAPWITVTGADPASAQPWATTSEVAQGDAMGRFSVAMPPGRYRVNAVPGTMFPFRAQARAGMARSVFGGATVVLNERDMKRVDVTLQER
jgi:hypothetical protein